MSKTKETELIIVNEQTNALELFKDKNLSEVVDQIEKEVRKFAPDLSTPTSRKEITSLAYKVSRSKTFIDDLGKTLTEDWEAKTRVVREQRKGAKLRLDSLRDEVKAPLIEFEEKEKLRIDGHQNSLQILREMGSRIELMDKNSEAIQLIIKQLEDDTPDKNFEEFLEQALVIRDQSLFSAKSILVDITKSEEQEKELEQFRKEKKVREEKEIQDKLKKEDDERATIQAQEKIKQEERRRQQAEQEKKDAEARAAQTELRAKQDAEKAEESKKEAARIAEVQKKAAVKKAKEDERKRIESELKRKEEADKKEEERLFKIEKERIENKRNIEIIEDDIIAAINNIQGESHLTFAEQIILNIKSGEIPHLTINY